MFVKGQKQQLRQLMQSPQWKAFEQLVEEMCAKLESTSNLQDTEWETLKSVCLNEGRVRGIRELIQETMRQATDAQG